MNKIIHKINILLFGTDREQLLKLMPKNSVCAEIGVWKGAFSKQIVSAIKPKKLHLVDPWKFQEEFGNRMFGGAVAKSQTDMGDIFNGVVEMFNEHPEVVYNRDFSNKAAADFEDEYFDWVYVDGNHYHEYVLLDLESYLPKVKKGGFLAGDDYKWIPEKASTDRQVERAVKDFINKYSTQVKFIKQFGNQYIIQKL